eukprot:m.352833 g.352833  ORF g.352833 m.352833 type:complete len:54 (-) comp19903_c22_seq10:932-1093(-)
MVPLGSAVCEVTRVVVLMVSADRCGGYSPSSSQLSVQVEVTCVAVTWQQQSVA